MQHSTNQGSALGICLVHLLVHLGFMIQRNFFETSHAKSEQDDAGSQVKQQASLAVGRGTASTTNAKELCDHLASHSHHFLLAPNQRASIEEFFYVPSEGPDAILCNQEGA